MILDSSLVAGEDPLCPVLPLANQASVATPHPLDVYLLIGAGDQAQAVSSQKSLALSHIHASCPHPLDSNGLFPGALCIVDHKQGSFVSTYKTQQPPLFFFFSLNVDSVCS